MKKVTVILGLFSLILFLSNGCTSKNKQQKENANLTTEEMTILSVDQILESADSLNGQLVTVEGVCTHICKHGGKKIFLMGTDDTKTIRIESTEKTGAFSQNCVNSMVAVTGKLVETRIDEAYLAQWEEQLKNETAEKHGNNEAAGCASERKAQNEAPVNTIEGRIANFRERIAAQKEKTGKEYLSFYHVEAESYKVL